MRSSLAQPAFWVILWFPGIDSSAKDLITHRVIISYIGKDTFEYLQKQQAKFKLRHYQFYYFDVKHKSETSLYVSEMREQQKCWTQFTATSSRMQQEIRHHESGRHQEVAEFGLRRHYSENWTEMFWVTFVNLLSSADGGKVSVFF